MNKGDEMGRFNMGSTIIIIFEAEESFQMNLQAGDKVLYGQQIGSHEEKAQDN